MRNLLLDPKEIESERQVVMEERRTRTEDDPDGYLSEEFLAVAYKAHPYGWPVIGWMRTSSASIRPSFAPSTTATTCRTTRSSSWPATSTRAACSSSASASPSAGSRAAPTPPPVDAVEPPQTGERRVLGLQGGRARCPSSTSASTCRTTVPGRARARAPVDHPAGGAGLAPVPDAGLRAAARARRGRRLRLPLARPQPLLVLGDAAARARRPRRSSRPSWTRSSGSRASRCPTRSWSAPRTRSRPRSSGRRTPCTRARRASPASS